MRNSLFPSLALAALLALGASASTAQRPAGIIGQWRTDDASAIVTIASCGEALCGRITRFLVPAPEGGFRDTRNPDRSLRSRSLVGVPVLYRLTRDRDGWSGRAYSPRDGRDVAATVTLPNANMLRIRGCVAVFCRTLDWTRAS